MALPERKRQGELPDRCLCAGEGGQFEQSDGSLTKGDATGYLLRDDARQVYEGVQQFMLILIKKS